MSLPIKKQIKSLLIKRLLKYERSNDFPYRDYFESNRCIFIHVPKTAGTSILSALSPGGYYRDHLTYLEYRKADLTRFNAYYKFAFVRNPYDRLVSLYNYLSSGGNKFEDLWYRDVFFKDLCSFDEFVAKRLDSDTIQAHPMFRPQYLYVYDYRRQLMVDKLGRYESLENDYQEVAGKLHISVSLGEKNRSSASKDHGFRSYYQEDKTVQKVRELYSVDFDLLGYSPDLSE